MPQQIQQPPQVQPQHFAALQLPVNTQPGFGAGKAAGMLFAVLIPAGLVAYANHLVFPESSWIALGMIITTCGVAGIFAIASGYATPKVRRYCLCASLVLCVVLSANLAAHWVLSRQVSGAKQATTSRHVEEDRAEARREAETKRQKELLAEQRALATETAKQLRMEAIRNDSARRLGIRAPSGARISVPQSAPVTALAAVEPSPQPTGRPEPPARLTVEQVMEKWSVWLLWFAVADLLCSVVAFGVCALMWEWDKNRNGVPDHLEQLLIAQQYQNILAQMPAQVVVQTPAVAPAGPSAAQAQPPAQPTTQSHPATPAPSRNGASHP